MPLSPIIKKLPSLFSFHCNEFSKLRLNLRRHFPGFLIFKRQHFVFLYEMQDGWWRMLTISYVAERLLGTLRKAQLGFLGRKRWAWGTLLGVRCDLNARESVQVRRTEFVKQRSGMKTWLRLFHCINALIKGECWLYVPNGCKNIYYCLAQEPDFQIR